MLGTISTIIIFIYPLVQWTISGLMYTNSDYTSPPGYSYINSTNVHLVLGIVDSVINKLYEAPSKNKQDNKKLLIFSQWNKNWNESPTSHQWRYVHSRQCHRVSYGPQRVTAPKRLHHPGVTWVTHALTACNYCPWVSRYPFSFFGCCQ